VWESNALRANGACGPGRRRYEVAIAEKLTAMGRGYIRRGYVPAADCADGFWNPRAPFQRLNLGIAILVAPNVEVKVKLAVKRVPALTPPDRWVAASYSAETRMPRVM